jgi:hypothetical protein
MSSSFPQGFTLGGSHSGSAELALEACILEFHLSTIRFQFHNLLRKAGQKVVSIGEMGSSGSDVTVHSPLASARSVLLWPRCDAE